MKIYLSNLISASDEALSENEKAREEHKEISKLIDESCSYIEATSKDNNNCLKRDIDIHDKNILHRSYICTSLLNKTEEAIVIYKKDSRKARQRIEPFLSIILLIYYLFVDLFFKALKKLFRTKAVKFLLRNTCSIIISLIAGLILFFVCFWLEKEGHLTSIYNYLNK